MKATKESVLAAALEVFPKSGYHNTKVSDICDAAGANVSAVNYYFQSKDNLYLEVWNRLWCDYEKRFYRIVNDPALSCRRKLACILEMNIKDSLSNEANNSLARLSFFEKSAPSPVFKEINGRYFQNIREKFFALMRDFLGSDCDEKMMKMAGLCVREPIYGVINLKIRGLQAADAKMIEDGFVPDFMDIFDDVDALVAAVVKYIFGGLEALKK